MRYSVMDHHKFWGWPQSNSDIQNAEVVFMWADWPFSSQVSALKSLGKKVVVWEHGFGALADYKLNDRPMLADGYLAIGDYTASLLGDKPVLVTGNPNYDNIKKQVREPKRALYVALHWVGDVTEYNRNIFNQLRETYDQFEWDVKVSDKTGGIPENSEYNIWYSGVEGERSLPKIRNRIRTYEAIFTPKPGTLDSFARLMGVPVYVVDEKQTFRQTGEPDNVKIENDNYIEIGEELIPRKVNMSNYIKTPSLSLDEILQWVEEL